jgi:hypothetical protein
MKERAMLENSARAKHEGLLGTLRENWTAEPSEKVFDAICHLLCRLRDKPNLKEMLDQSRQHEFPLWGVYASALAWSERRTISGADLNISRIPDYNRETMKSHMRGIDTFKRLLTHGDALRRNPEPVIFAHRLSPGMKSIAVVSCDPRYYLGFGPALIASFIATRQDCDGLHIHMSGGDSDCRDDLLSRAVQSGAVGVSFDDVKNAPRAYYACSRFNAARAVLQEFDVPVAVIDFDADFTGSTVRALRSFGRDDSTILGRAEHTPKLPWQLYMASFVVAPPNTYGSKFLLDFAELAAGLVAIPDIEHWFVDQNLLAYLFIERGYRITNAYKQSSALFRQKSKEHIKSTTQAPSPSEQGVVA